MESEIYNLSTDDILYNDNSTVSNDSIKQAAISKEERVKKFEEFFLNWAKIVYPKVNFIIDDNNRNILKQLYFYFLNNPKFEGDLNKGLLLFGNIGTGKTMLMRIFEKITKAERYEKRILLHCADDLNNDLIHRNETIDKYLEDWGAVICLDDIGKTDGKAKVYGSPVDPESQFFYYQYRAFTEKNILTAATTNLTIQELQNRYDKRLIDRFVEMFNYLYLSGCSRRK